jgi:hypothetical protein
LRARFPRRAELCARRLGDKPGPRGEASDCEGGEHHDERPCSVEKPDQLDHGSIVAAQWHADPGIKRFSRALPPQQAGRGTDQQPYSTDERQPSSRHTAGTASREDQDEAPEGRRGARQYVQPQTVVSKMPRRIRTEAVVEIRPYKWDEDRPDTKHEDNESPCRTGRTRKSHRTTSLLLLHIPFFPFSAGPIIKGAKRQPALAAGAEGWGLLIRDIGVKVTQSI